MGEKSRTLKSVHEKDDMKELKIINRKMSRISLGNKRIVNTLVYELSHGAQKD